MKRRDKKKNNKKILILFILILVLGISYFAYNKYLEEVEKNKLSIKLKDNLKVEINSQVYLKNFVDKIVNGEIVNGDKIVDTSKLGKNKQELSVKNKDGVEENYLIEFIVVDTTKPEIEGEKEITAYVGKDINLLDGVKVTDNSKEELKAKIVGEYDKNKAGKYNLKYEVTDSSGNKSEYDFILNIVSDPNNRTFTTSKGFLGKVVNGVTYIDGVLIVNKTYSLPSSYGNGLTSDTRGAFNKMQVDARALGLNIWIASGWRSYNDQKIIYNNYVRSDGQVAADTYSARAGHSEHQSGLTFDLNSIDDSFSYTAEGKWIHDNCYKYGFILRYPKGKENITGYMYESWHLRYVGGDLANKLYNGGDWITLEEYFGIDSKYS